MCDWGAYFVLAQAVLAEGGTLDPRIAFHLRRLLWLEVYSRAGDVNLFEIKCYSLNDPKQSKT